MDFFAGSGTLGVATMELNAKDGGDRAYILVTNGESSFAERIADPRLKAAESKFGGSHRPISQGRNKNGFNEMSRMWEGS